MFSFEYLKKIKVDKNHKSALFEAELSDPAKLDNSNTLLMIKNRVITLKDLPPPPPGKTGWPWTEMSKPDEAFEISQEFPMISVVTPSFNQSEYIEETIRSILLQGYPNLEYWVIDGGSTDNTLEILHKYEHWLSGWISEKDKGQADAINKGWQRSKGDFLGWLNSDDVLLPNSFWIVIDYFRLHPEIGYVYGDIERIDRNGKFITKSTYKDFNIEEIIKSAGWISQPGNLFRRQILETIGYLDDSLYYQLDFDYWIRAGLLFKFGYIRQPLARFRVHELSKTSSKNYIAGEDIFHIYNKLFNMPDLPKNIKEIQKQAMGSAYLYSSATYLNSKKYLKAYKLLFTSILADSMVVFRKEFRKHLILLSVSRIFSKNSKYYLVLKKIYNNL